MDLHEELLKWSPQSNRWSHHCCRKRRPTREEQNLWQIENIHVSRLYLSPRFPFRKPWNWWCKLLAQI